MRTEIEALERGKELVVVEREIGDGFRKLIVGYHGNFIGGPKPGSDRDQALLHLRRLFLRKIVINHDDRRKRIRIGRKTYNLLLDAVLQDPEFIAAEIADKLAVMILNGDGNNDDFGVAADVG